MTKDPFIFHCYDYFKIDLVIANAAVMIPVCGRTEDIATVVLVVFLNRR